MAIVLDASVLAELLIGSRIGVATAEQLTAHGGNLHLPHLAVVETASVLRRWVSLGEVRESRASSAVRDLCDFPALRWPVEPLLPRVWQLRSTLTAYDATYVALAEALDATLLTSDGRLARGLAGVSRCPVVTIAA